MRLTVAVLAGGESRRMGLDKAMIVLEGATLLERVVTTALDAGMHVLVVGRARPTWWRIDGVQFIDEPIHRGPLSGLEAALHNTGGDLILVACDMPRLSSRAFAWLAAASAAAGADGLVTVNGDRVEPLFSLYRQKSLCRVRMMLAEDRRAMHELVSQGEFERIDSPPWLQAELHNVNRPEDLDDSGSPALRGSFPATGDGPKQVSHSRTGTTSMPAPRAETDPPASPSSGVL